MMKSSRGSARVLGLLLIGLLLSGCGTASGPSGPLPFSKLPYAEAASAATAQGKLFLVDATATWCGPCRQMERETWPDAAVGAWIAAHAVAVQVDVDRAPEIAQQLGVEAMPTLILFRDGKELARSVGGMDPGELLTWLARVAP